MVVLHLTQAVVNKISSKEKRYDIRDSKVRGLFLRVEVSGKRTWYLNYKSPPPISIFKNKKLAPGEVSLSGARELAKRFISYLYVEGVDPALSNDVKVEVEESISFRELLELYKPFVLSHKKSGDVTIRMLKLFDELMDIPIILLTSTVIENWQTSNIGILKGATINRRVAALQGMLKWAIERGIISSMPFKVNKISEKDSKDVIRYLSEEERVRLFKTLDKREKKYGKDFLKTAVIVSLNTGIRKGTLLSLVWEDIDLDNKRISLRASIMKGGKNVILPLNQDAFVALSDWQKITNCSSGYIFPGDGTRLSDTKNLFNKVIKEANIENFTWHCMRHDFASQLAIKGVSLHIIQKLMCHSSSEMTQRYAHLSMEALENALEILEQN
ncbi:MAG: site-specific integrase [Synergistaceae bacterium]